jgi:hypothetical protein
MKPQEALIECPFCGKESIKVLRIPFVKQVKSSQCRAGGKNTRIQKSGEDILSGCSECGKSKEEVIAALEGNDKKMTDEQKLKRLREAGLPTTMEFEVD